MIVSSTFFFPPPLFSSPSFSLSPPPKLLFLSNDQANMQLQTATSSATPTSAPSAPPSPTSAPTPPSSPRTASSPTSAPGTSAAPPPATSPKAPRPRPWATRLRDGPLGLLDWCSRACWFEVLVVEEEWAWRNFRGGGWGGKSTSSAAFVGVVDYGLDGYWVFFFLL